MRNLGFTLIELLVVITIIVVLLALLTPALDKAITAAQLTICGTNHKAITSGIQAYAAVSKRRYPRTQPARGTGRQLAQGFDARPLLRDYMSINGVFNDPFVSEVNFDSDRQGLWVWSNYNWFAGWGFANAGGMYKMGDAFRWTGQDWDGNTRNFKVRVVSGDRDRWWESEISWSCSHPDDEGLLEEVALEESGSRAEWEAGDDAAAATLRAGSFANTALVTLNEWVNTIDRRGKLSLNFAFDDGSVERFEDLEMHDERLQRVPHTAGEDRNNPALSDRAPAE